MPNTFITPSVVAREMTMVLVDEAVLYGLTRNPAHEAQFTGAEKVGSSITIRTPIDGSIREKAVGVGATTDDVTEGSETLTIEKHFYKNISLDTLDWSLKLDQFAERILRPVARNLAQELSQYIAAKSVAVPYWAGNVGDPPDTVAEITALSKVLDGNKAPVRGRQAVVDEVAKADLQSMEPFYKADTRADGGLALREASLGMRTLGFDWSMDQAIYEHTAGTMQAANPLVDVGGGVLAGAVSMDIDDVGAGVETILTGDLFTVANVTGYQGVFTNDTTAVAGQITGATFYPAAPTGGFADSAAITILASHTKNLAFVPGAFTAVAIPPAAPQGQQSATFFDAESGLGIRVVYGWSTSGIAEVLTVDLLAGAHCQQPELAAILLG